MAKSTWEIMQELWDTIGNNPDNFRTLESAQGAMSLLPADPLSGAVGANQLNRAVNSDISALSQKDPREMIRQSASTAELYGEGALNLLGALPIIGGVTKKLKSGKKYLSKVDIKKIIPDTEADVARSFLTDKRLKDGGTIPAEEVDVALQNRARYREEPRTLPKRPEEMSQQEWVDFGNQYGADFNLNPPQSLGVIDPKTGREISIAGGLDGKFTIPDLFHIKANNFDPSALPQDVHNQLMHKFIRTYQREQNDAVDIFNDLNFSLLSPNAPLTPNEFLAQRFRIQTPEQLAELAQRSGAPNLSQAMDAESGVGAASRGGFGAKGTADIGQQAELARLLIEKPEMFSPMEGETLRDVGWRVMNQVPGLSVKTASLGVPWTNLEQANTSAVDLWMIRKNYERLMQEDPDFAKRMATLLEKNPSLSPEDAAINIIGGGHPSLTYRLKSGELNQNVPSSLLPEKLAFEPEKFTMPNPFYQKVMGYVDESRGTNPEIELFPEQWRLWDRYRGRVEPHEMAHPDWKKIPKQSFTELQESLKEHRNLGYMSAPNAPIQPNNTVGDWRKLYYGFADQGLLPYVAGSSLLGAGAMNYFGDE